MAKLFVLMVAMFNVKYLAAIVSYALKKMGHGFGPLACSLS